MYSILALLLTIIEVGAAITGYALHSELIFYSTIVYGSPFYLIQHAFGADSLLQQKPVYWGFCLFHVIKYFLIIQAQRKDEGGFVRNTAMLLEAAYLAASAYYLL